ncbi:hypothetical protein, partial [Ravibacter arvi]|uniref:hypothetical protein n=1 Tax=Ravibacter arvi TaxID=2051041 RepID=UPI0031E5A6F4
MPKGFGVVGFEGVLIERSGFKLETGSDSKDKKAKSSLTCWERQKQESYKYKSSYNKSVCLVDLRGFGFSGREDQGLQT